MKTRRILLALLATGALLGMAAPASAATSAPAVTIDPALHFTPGGTYDWYANGDMTYEVFVKWHMSSASKICAVNGTVTGYYGDELSFSGDPKRRTYAFEYSGYAAQSTAVTLRVTDCAGRTTTTTKVVKPGLLVDDVSATYTKTWKTGSCFRGGCWMNSTIHKTWQAGATSSFRVTGNAFALITDNRGTFDVYFDGTLVAHVVAGQSSVRNGYLTWTTYKVTRATHTITVVARSGRVDVDGVFAS